jgi:hypothetical protein
MIGRSILPLWLMFLLLLPATATRAAWLEGLRWFEHAGFTRVVFDLSQAVDFRVAPSLKDGYVDVILQGELSRRMPEQREINARGVLSARQLRATSTSLTWRIQCENIARVSQFSLDETPYKVVVDFHRLDAAPSPPAAEASPAAEKRPAPAPAKPIKAATPRSKPAAMPVGLPAGQDARFEGLGEDLRRRLLIGELLLESRDTSQAIPHLERVQAGAAGHAWTRWLLACSHQAIGDDYRARRLFEDLADIEAYAPAVAERLDALRPPDARGVLSGGDLREEELVEYLAVLRRGRILDPADLYRTEEPSPGGHGFWPGLLLGALLGIVIWGLQQLWLRQRDLGQRQRAIVAESLAAAGSVAPTLDRRDPPPGVDYADVSRRVREELEQHLQEIQREAPRDEAPRNGGHADHRAPVTEPGREREVLSLEEQVYRLADQRRSIVEIAETLNMGVDEVRLVLELREQAGQLGNS